MEEKYKLIYLILHNDTPLIAFENEEKAQEELKKRNEFYKGFADEKTFRIETVPYFEKI